MRVNGPAFCVRGHEQQRRQRAGIDGPDVGQRRFEQIDDRSTVFTLIDQRHCGGDGSGQRQCEHMLRDSGQHRERNSQGNGPRERCLRRRPTGKTR